MKPRETHPPFLLTPKGLVIGLLVISVMGTGFLFIPPAHAAYTPTVANAAFNGCGTCSSTTITTTIFQAGDTIAVMGQLVNSVDGFIDTISTVTSTAVSGGFTLQQTALGYCVISAAFCGGAAPDQPFRAELWVGTATTSGAGQTIVITATRVVSSVLAGESFDIAYVDPTPVVLATGTCNARSGVDCGSPIVTSNSVAIVSGSNIEIMGAATRGAAISGVGAASYTFNGPGVGNWGGGYSTTASSVSSPTNFPLAYTGGSGLNSGYAIIGAVFAPIAGTTTTTTTVINTACLGACSGGNNGTSIFSITMPNTYVFQQSQNTASVAQVDNFTMKVSSVHITTTSATIYVVTCMPVTPTLVASGGNPWNCFNPASVFITNNTSNFFIHVNPQTLICSSCYYAVGIFTPTTASRGSGASGAGIAFYETSQTGITQYRYSVGSSTPPVSFFGNTVVRPNLFMFIHTTNTVATTTSITTTTLTGTFTSIVTSSTTQTFTTLNENLAVSTGVDFSIMILILMAPAMALTIALGVVTRSPQGAGLGFVAGLAIGAGVGNKVGLVPPVLVGVVVIVMIFILVGVFAIGRGH